MDDHENRETVLTILEVMAQAAAAARAHGPNEQQSLPEGLYVLAETILSDVSMHRQTVDAPTWRLARLLHRLLHVAREDVQQFRPRLPLGLSSFVATNTTDQPLSFTIPKEWQGWGAPQKADVVATIKPGQTRALIDGADREVLLQQVVLAYDAIDQLDAVRGLLEGRDDG